MIYVTLNFYIIHIVPLSFEFKAPRLMILLTLLHKFLTILIPRIWSWSFRLASYQAWLCQMRSLWQFHLLMNIRLEFPFPILTTDWFCVFRGVSYVTWENQDKVIERTEVVYTSRLQRHSVGLFWLFLLGMCTLPNGKNTFKKSSWHHCED